MFREQGTRPDLWAIQQSLTAYWKENHIFEKSVESRPASNPYRFYDGPPFITGLPHYGHLASSVAKDVIPRFQTMKGKRVERTWGWDCHGIPIEQKVQKKLGLTSGLDIEKIGMETFIEGCYDYTRSTSSEWNRYVDNFARRVDMDNSYKTMDNDYMESVWWAFKEIRNKGLIYKGKRVSMYSTKLETPISNFEVAMDDSYGEVNDPAVTVKFKQKDTEDTFFLAWTTTPRTIPANIGLAVNNSLTYVKVSSEGSYYILAKARIEDIFKGRDYEVVDEFDGASLVGLEYIPCFDYYTGSEFEGNKFVVIHADFANDENGTGVVQQAPEFGEDDFNSGKENGLLITEAMNKRGEYTAEISDMEGVYYRDANETFAEKLKEKGLLFKKESITHRVAFCPRTHIPLVFKAQDSWFIDIQAVKPRLIEKNEEINRYPDHFKHGRFLKSIESAPDRGISRTRYWGTPMPVYVPEEALESGNIEASDAVVIGSREELFLLQQTGSNTIEKRSESIDGEEKTIYRDTSRDAEFDMHRPYIDKVRFVMDGVKYVRIPEVLDCRMESGAMPYGQMHYPFENKEKMEASFPADYIVEYTGQIRAWFYVMHVLGVILFDKPAFKNVICHGVVYGNDGRKMSKSLGNFPDPKPTFKQYGGDAIRMNILTSPLFNAGDTAITEDGIGESLRNYILPLWNAFSFFVMYANIDQRKPTVTSQKLHAADCSNVLDQWILGELEILLATTTKDLEGYDIQNASRELGLFLDNLTNWYIRRSRRRFWKSESDTDKHQAYQTLYYVLMEFCTIASPFMPFITEYIYKELKLGVAAEKIEEDISIHLLDWPEVDDSLVDENLSRSMELTQKIVKMGLGWRSQNDIRVRQPLSAMRIGADLSDYYLEILAEELNIKSVVVDQTINGLVTEICKPNGRLIGPKFGGDVKNVFAEAKAGNFEKNTDGSVLVAGKWQLEAGEYEISYKQKEENSGDTDADQGMIVDNGLVLVVDTVITDELRLEGDVRDLVRAIQDARKEAGYNVADRITLSLKAKDASTNSGFVETLLATWQGYLEQETLSTILEDLDDQDIEKEVILGDEILIVGLKK